MTQTPNAEAQVPRGNAAEIAADDAAQPSFAPQSSPDRPIAASAAATAALLVLLKAYGWGASGSVALMASAIESGLNLVAALTILFALRWSNASRDPHARRRIEAFAGLMHAGLIFALALVVAWRAVGRIFVPRELVNGDLGVVVIALSVLVAMLLWVVQGQQRRANAKTAPDLATAPGVSVRFTSHILPNVVALIGVASAAWLGAAQLDAIAGLMLAIWMFWGGVNLLWEAADVLLGSGLPAGLKRQILDETQSDARVVSAALVAGPSKTRLQLKMDPGLDADQVAAIVDEAQARIWREHPGVAISVMAEGFDPAPGDPQTEITDESGAVDAVEPTLGTTAVPETQKSATLGPSTDRKTDSETG